MKVFSGLHVKVAARENASPRTQARVNENMKHGLIVRGTPQPVKGLDNREGIMFIAASPAANRGDKWMGWLPTDEIDMKVWVTR